MRTLIVWMTLIVLAPIGITENLEYLRQIYLVNKVGIKASRFSMEMIYFEDWSIRFGAEGTLVLGFSLPAGYSGLSECGKGNFWPVGKEKLSALSLNKTFTGCTSNSKLLSGPSYYLSDRTLFIVSEW